MASCAVATFVKTPGLSPIKTRLAADTTPEFALECYELCIRALKCLVGQSAREESSIEPYWAIAEAEGIFDKRWSGFENVVQKTGDLGVRIYHVWETLRVKHDAVIILAADSPQISVDDIVSAVRKITFSTDNDFVLGPAHDGGFYLLGGRGKLQESFWNSIPWSSSGTAQSVIDEVTALGHPIERLRTISDIDTKPDLAHVVAELKKLPQLLPEQQLLLEHIDRALRPTTGNL